VVRITESGDIPLKHGGSLTVMKTLPEEIHMTKDVFERLWAMKPEESKRGKVNVHKL